jgi:hypothetical protein
LRQGGAYEESSNNRHTNDHQNGLLHDIPHAASSQSDRHLESNAKWQTTLLRRPTRSWLKAQKGWSNRQGVLRIWPIGARNWLQTERYLLRSGPTGLLWHWMIVAADSVLVVFSAFCFAVGVWPNLNPGAPLPRPDVRQLPAFLLVSVSGFLVLVSIAELVGIWAG